MMRVLYICSNNISNFSENSNAFQQPYNLSLNSECVIIAPSGTKVNKEITDLAFRVYYLKVTRTELLLNYHKKVEDFWNNDIMPSSSFDCIISDFSEWSISIANYLHNKVGIPWYTILWDSPFGNRYELKRSFLSKIEHQIRLYLYNKKIAQSKICFCFMNKGVLDAEKISFPKVQQLVNGVDFDIIEKVNSKGISKEPFSICATGRIRYDKGCKEIIASFNEIGKQFPQATLTFIGQLDGSNTEKQAIEESIRTHPYANRIFITGRLPFFEAMTVVAKSEIGIHAYSPSRYLYWNHVLKVGEYQAFGIAPIAVKYPGTSDLIDNGLTGILINSNSGHEIASAVERLFSNRSLLESISERALTSVRKRSWKLVTGQMFEVIRDLAKKNLSYNA